MGRAGRVSLLSPGAVAVPAAAKALEPDQRIRIHVRVQGEVPFLKRIVSVEKPAERDQPKDQSNRRGK